MQPTEVQSIELFPEGNHSFRCPCKRAIDGGTYTNVFKVCRLINGKPISVKSWRGTSHNRCFTREHFLQELKRELRVWGQLKHVNIVPVLGITEENAYSELPSLVLPFYKNGNAITYLQSNPDARMISILQDIICGLSHLHAQNPPIVHGSIRGSNIFIDDNGRACLTDLSQMNIIEQLNLSSNNCESCRWLAPEIMDIEMSSSKEENAQVHCATDSDVYSFGMTAIELMTRHRPFSHIRRDPLVIFEVISGRRPHRPSAESCPQLTNELWSLFEACWAHKSSNRPTANFVSFYLKSITELCE